MIRSLATSFAGVVLLFSSVPSNTVAQNNELLAYNTEQSVARNWNEVLLFAIRRDFARPTVHARNLFHASAAMYDSWALYTDTPSLYFLGRTRGPDNSALPECRFSRRARRTWLGLDEQELIAARRTTLSFAMYRLLHARFANSPGAAESLPRIESLFWALGFDPTIESSDISDGNDPAKLGNYLANCVIAFAQKDGANESNNYANQLYTPSNPPLNPIFSGNPGLIDPNRWQPLELTTFIDQSGNLTNIPIFLGAEWGAVAPFALSADDISQVRKDNMLLPAYLDPGPPTLLSDNPVTNRDYQQGHALVAMWSSHLDPSDGVSWNISPANLGNVADLPHDGASILDFYNAVEGGTKEMGYPTNPITGIPYAEQHVPRGDFTRVLAEFWADGPDSETPPGHWFQIYNSFVSDHPEFRRRIGGNGLEVDPFEFDVRTYFTLGAAMHDSAIAAWSIKGAYDYIRPISALRYMASLGQSTDFTASNYHHHGIPLKPGFIETVLGNDPLAGHNGNNIGKIKARAWRGPDLISSPNTDLAGVDWILLEDWLPYQRASFVTPPFAGYVSGHSTFSRAAADVLSAITGSDYFPGGLAEFTANKNEFLAFERGPSVDITLQWASFRDASDQTSLSRIWGGIHPPIDDIPGRRIGSQVAKRVLSRTQMYFNGEVDHASALEEHPLSVHRRRGGCSIMSDSKNQNDTVIWLLLLTSILVINLRSAAHRC